MKSYRITEKVGKVHDIYHCFQIGEIVHPVSEDPADGNCPLGSLWLTNGEFNQYVQPDCVEEVNRTYKVVGNTPRYPQNPGPFHYFPIGIVVEVTEVYGHLWTCKDSDGLEQLCYPEHLEEVNPCSE